MPPSRLKVHEELKRLEHAKLLEAKLRAQRRVFKPSGRTASIAALKVVVSASGLDELSELALHGLPSLVGLMEPQKCQQHGVRSSSPSVMTKLHSHRYPLHQHPHLPQARPACAQIWLRSKDLSSKKPASEKQLPQFEQRMKELSMPSQLLPTEQIATLYNKCAHTSRPPAN